MDLQLQAVLHLLCQSLLECHLRLVQQDHDQRRLIHAHKTFPLRNCLCYVCFINIFAGYLTKASVPQVKIDVYASKYTREHFLTISSPLTVISLQSPRPKPII